MCLKKGILLFILLARASKASSESCLTPDGKEGECISITDCPGLFEAFTNPLKEEEARLAKFICQTSAKDNKVKTYNVCCGTDELNIQINPEEDRANLNILPDRRYCGLQHRDDYFSKDTSIAIHEFPWLATYVVGTLSTGDMGVRCGGTLISNRYVLTTAWCVLYEKSLNTNPEVIRLGDFHLSNKTDCVHLDVYNDSDCSSYVEYGIEETISHPFYDIGTRFNDIALIRLNKTVTYSDYIRPICLPTQGTTYAKPDEVMYATRLGNWVGTLVKKKIKTKLMKNSDCKSKLELISASSTSEPRRPFTSNHFCTWDTDDNEISACIYDRGGPTMFSYKNQWHIEGILIYPWCYRKEPIVNTRVSKYLLWIVRNMRL